LKPTPAPGPARPAPRPASPRRVGYTIVFMCRLLGYIGAPIALDHVLFDTDSSLVRQSYSPRMMATFLNLAGFGMAAWDPRSIRAEEPLIYRVTTMPAFDRNLRNLAAKMAPTCLIAHVRGVTYSEKEMVAETNLHPFRFPSVAVVLAHNGHLREFARPAGTGSQHPRDDGFGMDLRAHPLAAGGPLWPPRRAGARRCDGRGTAHSSRGEGASRHRYLLPGESVPEHG
jgi:hypothetical protein